MTYELYQAIFSVAGPSWIFDTVIILNKGARYMLLSYRYNCKWA